MSDKFTPVPTDSAELERLDRQRNANRAVIEQFLSIKGADRPAYERRLALLSEDVMYEIVFTMDTLPERVSGLNKVRRRYEDNAKCWSRFEYRNVEIRETQFPDVFLVECDQYGTITNPMFADPAPVREHHNYGFLMFVLRDGKIRQLRLFNNPMKLLHDFWKEMPNYVC